jgi:hypothetical protein
MVRAEMYFREAKGNETMGEMRVSIRNKWGHVLEDLSYEEFLKKKGHKEIRLLNRVNLAELT